jgi:hypothetical protein
LIDYDSDVGYEEHYGSSKWYDIIYSGLDHGMKVFFNSVIYARYGNTFLISNISKREYGYEVQCYGPREVRPEISPEFNWDIYPGDPEMLVTLHLFIDGEYMDIYMNGVDDEHKFGSLIRVREEFIRQFQLLIKTGTCDLTNVIWPRRADGSMDYPPPQLTRAVPDQPGTVASDTPAAAEHEDTAAVTPERETLAQEPGIGLPLIVALAALGAVAVAGAAVFLIRRKK